VHALVLQQRFARAEFQRGLEGLTDEEARFRPEKADGSRMNCISWTIGHLANQEAWFFVRGLGGESVDKRLHPFLSGQPASEPPLDEVLALWRETMDRVDRLLEDVDDETLGGSLQIGWPENAGTALMRNTYHYWFHAGEVNAIRQLLGHPEIIFVGPMLGQLEFPL
jgi:hypothetical protein